MVLLRKLVVKAIYRTVHHANQVAESRAGQMLLGSGLLADERRRQRTSAMGSVLRSLASAVIFCVGTLMVISALQISVTPILASVSVVGAALGFGARDMVSDFLAGVFMILEDQYGIGDTIDTGQATGTVQEVGLRITKVRDIDGVIWYVRNGAIDRIGNKSQGWNRAVVDVPVAYTEDVGRVHEIMTATAEELYDDEKWRGKFMAEKPRVVGIESLDADLMIIRIQAQTAPQKSVDVARELRARLKKALDEAGIVVAAVKTSN
ncbi:MAG TPA: mechanosensitive ion channel family protein [Actinocrinis sp.]|nr:mechanosensitive ion channel family protein [Actinocrinis sp.]